MRIGYRDYCLPLMFACLSVPLVAQVPNPTVRQDRENEHQVQMRNGIAYYKIQVVDRTLPAINYFSRGGTTKIGFAGTELLPSAKGEAKVESRNGRTSIDASIEGLPPANGFGTEYLTYVLWAITPQGRPVNLGELIPTGSKHESHIHVTTDLQSFGLMVTAEPYFAVTMPSDLVVAQNVVLKDTSGVIQPVNAHYELLPRGAYADTAGRHTVLHPIKPNDHTPLELYEAQNALMIAQAAGAQKYAPEGMATAQNDLTNAEEMNAHKHDSKRAITYAREAVQMSEDARIMTIRKIRAEDEANERQARVEAQQKAETAQQQAQQEQQQAEEARAKAEEAKQQAQQEQQQAQQAQQQAEQAKEQAQQAQLAQQQAAQQAQAEAAQRARAEAAAAAAQAQAQKAQQEQQQAQEAAQQAKQEAQQERERLKQQLSAVFQTRETARGLIMNMPDVLFGFDKYNLKPEARVKLAKVSGILLAYPDLKVQVEGYTDSIGSETYNQKLSEKRADSVRDFLVKQNVKGDNITAEGYGEQDPVASNSTSSGRAENRRVELVVSGASIGIQQSQPTPGGDADSQPSGQPTSHKPVSQTQPGGDPQ